MTDLPKEWIDEASNISNTKLKGSTNERQLGYEDGFTDGATAYKQAVEGKLNKFKSEIQKDLDTLSKDHWQYKMLGARKSEIELILTELQTLKPTSNDNTTTK